MDEKDLYNRFLLIYSLSIPNIPILQPPNMTGSEGNLDLTVEGPAYGRPRSHVVAKRSRILERQS